MNPTLRDELVAMKTYDQSVRAELAADGSLFDGYHPRMAAVHRAHAARLREIIAEFGWPDRPLVGDEGAHAAWLIAQHAIGEPSFMRQCRALLEASSARGDADRAHFAFLDDRICVYEDRPQRYGTQLRGGPDGLEPCPLEDAEQVEAWRRDVGLPSLAEIVTRAQQSPAGSQGCGGEGRGRTALAAIGWMDRVSDIQPCAADGCGGQVLGQLMGSAGKDRQGVSCAVGSIGVDSGDVADLCLTIWRG